MERSSGSTSSSSGISATNGADPFGDHTGTGRRSLVHRVQRATTLAGSPRGRAWITELQVPSSKLANHANRDRASGADGDHLVHRVLIGQQRVSDGSAHLGPPRSSSTYPVFGGSGTPAGVAVGPDGRVCVVDGCGVARISRAVSDNSAQCWPTIEPLRSSRALAEAGTPAGLCVGDRWAELADRTARPLRPSPGPTSTVPWSPGATSASYDPILGAATPRRASRLRPLLPATVSARRDRDRGRRTSSPVSESSIESDFEATGATGATSPVRRARLGATGAIGPTGAVGSDWINRSNRSDRVRMERSVPDHRSPIGATGWPCWRDSPGPAGPPATPDRLGTAGADWIPLARTSVRLERDRPRAIGAGWPLIGAGLDQAVPRVHSGADGAPGPGGAANGRPDQSSPPRARQDTKGEVEPRHLQDRRT